MRVADRPVPTIGGHRPPVERWPAALHIGIEKQPTVSYVYDDYSATYDAAPPDFVYDDLQAWPYDRQDLYCQFHGLKITTGATDPDVGIEAGHVELTLDNRDGSLSQYDNAGRLVDFFPGRALDIWAEIGEGVPQVDGYLDASIGTVTTSDPGPLPNDCTFVYKVRGPTTVGQGGTIASQWTSGLRYIVSEVMASPSYYQLYFNPTADSRVVYGSAFTGADEYRALSMTLTDGINSVFRAYTSPDGQTWTQSGAKTAAPITLTQGTDPLRIGADGNTGNTRKFPGRIYWVELRSGLDPAAGTVLWRFDANDYPGTGTSYTDPRGRTWTLTSATAITPKIPEIPSAYWLFSGTITAWRERADGTIDAEAFDAFSDLNRDVADWDPGIYGDTVAARLGAICDRFAFTGPRRFDLGLVRLHSYVSQATPLEELRSVARSDGGLIGVDVDGALVYRDRYWWIGRTDQPEVPILSDNVCDTDVIVWGAELSTDDDLIANVADLKNVADVAVHAQNDWSIARYGPQTIPGRTDDQWIDPDDGAALAEHLVTRRGDGYVRLEQFNLYLHDPRQDLWRVGIDRRIGDIVTFAHEQPSTTGVDLLVLNLVVSQLVHDITPDTWTTTVATTRAVGSRVVLRYDRTPYRYDDPAAVYVL